MSEELAKLIIDHRYFIEVFERPELRRGGGGIIRGNVEFLKSLDALLTAIIFYDELLLDPYSYKVVTGESLIGVDPRESIFPDNQISHFLQIIKPLPDNVIPIEDDANFKKILDSLLSSEYLRESIISASIAMGGWLNENDRIVLDFGFQPRKVDDIFNRSKIEVINCRGTWRFHGFHVIRGGFFGRGYEYFPVPTYMEDFLDDVCECIAKVHASIAMGAPYMPHHFSISNGWIEALHKTMSQNTFLMDAVNLILEKIKKTGQDLALNVQRELKELGHEITWLHLPPVLSTVLQEAENAENILDVALNMRRQAKGTRKFLKELNSAIREGRKSEIAKKLETVHKAICHFSEKYDAHEYLKSMLSYAPELGLASMDKKLLAQLLSRILKNRTPDLIDLLIERIKYRQVSFLHKLTEKYLVAPSAELLLKKVLGIKLSPHEKAKLSYTK